LNPHQGEFVGEQLALGLAQPRAKPNNGLQHRHRVMGAIDALRAVFAQRLPPLLLPVLHVDGDEVAYQPRADIGDGAAEDRRRPYHGGPAPEWPLFALYHEPRSPVEAQKVMQGFIAGGEYIDRVIRVPFDIVLIHPRNPQGTWHSE
jgi:hypothetical protein